MEVNCEGCAGCCVDWRPVGPGSLDHERRGRYHPLDDAYNFVPLTRDEVHDFLQAGYGDVMTPRLWRLAEDGSDGPAVETSGTVGRTERVESAGSVGNTGHTQSGSDGGGGRGRDHAVLAADRTVEIDGHRLAAIDGKPAFFVGLRKAPKPVAPFGIEPTWLRTCVFLDPDTLQCRIHAGDLYPRECAEYPGHNLVLGHETECERVEAAYGGDRLHDDTPPAVRGLLLGPQAVGAKVFVHPDPTRLEGVISRAIQGTLSSADRAEFVGVAAASTPGSTEVDRERAERARERALAADSWVGQAFDAWKRRAGRVGTRAEGAPTGRAVEELRGAPRTPGW